jgi:hypothetical protein
VCQPRPDRTPCGDACCEQDEVCLEDPGGPPWIWRCCPDELNVNGRCCDGNKTVCGPPPGGQPWERYCCSEGTVCCGGDSCCPLDTHVCCNGHCLPKNLGPWFSCGNHCCRSEYDQCCGDGCCAKEAVCCGDPPRCCPRGYHCCGQFCCRD